MSWVEKYRKFNNWRGTIIRDSRVGTGSCKFKVARVVKKNWVLWSDFSKFINTDQVIQNSTSKFRQSSIISENPDYLSEKLKTLTCSNYHKV